MEANTAFCAMLGYSRTEVLTLNVADWDAQWSGKELTKKLDELMAAPAVFEMRYRRKDGSIRAVEINSSNVTLDGADYFYAAACDITDRKRVELELRDSETKYRAIFNNEVYAIAAMKVPDWFNL